MDLLDRLIIIKTYHYTREEIASILSLRAEVEGIQIQPQAFQRLAELGENTSLRHAVQLLTPAQVICCTDGREVVEIEDVEEVAGLFLDASQSVVRLQDEA